MRRSNNEEATKEKLLEEAQMSWHWYPEWGWCYYCQPKGNDEARNAYENEKQLNAKANKKLNAKANKKLNAKANKKLNAKANENQLDAKTNCKEKEPQLKHRNEMLRHRNEMMNRQMM